MHAKYRHVLAAVGGAVCFWGLLGFIAAKNFGTGGYETRLGAEVVRVEPAGPADVAGLKAGDRIVRVNGTPVGNAWQLPSRARAEVGEIQRLEVERGGDKAVVEVVWGPLTADRVTDLIVDGCLTLAFIGFGLCAFLFTGTRSGFLLAAFGLCYGAAFFRGPSPGPLDGAVTFVQSNLSLLLVALLLHFLTVFPWPRGILRRPMARWCLYVPFFFFLAFGFVEWFTFPALLAEYATTMMMIDLLYMLLSVAALVHCWVSLSRRERRESGFNFIPLGLVIAIGPIVAIEIIEFTVPGFSLPWRNYFPLLGAVIPAGMAAATIKDAGTPPFVCSRRSDEWMTW